MSFRFDVQLPKPPSANVELEKIAEARVKVTFNRTEAGLIITVPRRALLVGGELQDERFSAERGAHVRVEFWYVNESGMMSEQPASAEIASIGNPAGAPPDPGPIDIVNVREVVAPS